MLAELLLSKDIKKARIEKTKMNEPKFARFLARRTGETIDSQRVCRMENFGAKDACNPVRPSRKVVDVVDAILTCEEPAVK
jgi:hypothetical protein